MIGGTPAGAHSGPHGGAHSRWKLAGERRRVDGHRESLELEQERQEHRLTMALAKVVHDRRVELGLSIAELASRIGLSNRTVERIEGADVVVTLALLTRLAAGLDGSLRFSVDATGASVFLVEIEPPLHV
ncbi:ribosome-binding protein aMBF1 (putative translation factor) [Streptacidiphilus sp. MAP12-33]|uniref:helix-turn-helix domain-containing protein n=1 Tax=Streptacidiphilus sp. MAP12-33 TaxID=3156266 RepID=UPI0035186368